MGELDKRPVIAGVDTHKDTHTLCLIDHMGRTIGTFEFAADAKGHDSLADKIGDPATCIGVGVEGTGSYGAGLTRRLLELGYRVHEVMVPRRAKRRPGRPKSDPADAEVAARQLPLPEPICRNPRNSPGGRKLLRRLMIARERLVQATSAMINAAKSLIVTAHEDLRVALGESFQKRPEARPRVARLRRRRRPSGFGGPGKGLDPPRPRGGSHRGRDEGVLEANAPALLAIFGCGTVTAAALAVAGGGNPERLGSEAEFASLCGVAPLLASSGKTERRRLNRGGDRRANRALYQIAVTRMSYDGRTKDYVAKRKRGGKSKKETIRCLKRYIAREVFRALRRPLEVKGPSWKDLRPARQALGITLVEAGEALNVGFQKVSYAETGRLMNAKFLEEYDAWLKSQLRIVG